MPRLTTRSMCARMIQDMQLVGLSARTQEAYVRVVDLIARHYRTRPDRITERQIREYFLFLRNERALAPASLKMVRHGLRFFFRHTAPRRSPTLERMRIRVYRTLPDVLTIDEVRRIIDAVTTMHGRAFIWTTYSLGLRLSEALNLQIGDIDDSRRMIHIHRGKGARDRFVPLPQRTVETLRNYWSTHQNPTWFFPACGSGVPAHTADRPLAHSSVQNILRFATRRVGIAKRVSIHTLRHSYATHLLEAGVSLGLIQRYLGHSSLLTTTLYLHLTTRGHEGAIEVIDRLMS